MFVDLLPCVLCTPLVIVVQKEQSETGKGGEMDSIARQRVAFEQEMIDWNGILEFGEK